MKHLNILVTAVGSPLGQSIFKALKISSLPLNIVLMDSYPFAISSVLNQPHSTCAFVNDPTYLENITTFIRHNAITGIFWGSEVEAKFYAKNKSLFDSSLPGVYFFTNTSDISQQIQDKLFLAEHLRKKGILAPLSASGDNLTGIETLIADVGFPIIVKPKSGASSVGLRIVKNREDLFTGLTGNDVVQQCLKPSDQEYTVGVYRDTKGLIISESIIKRELKFGLTYKAVVVSDPEISDYCRQVAHAVDARFSINIQLIKSANGPAAFEINPRFSSTTSIRAHFGINEPELAIRDALLKESLIPIKGRTGAALRMWEEKYLSTEEYVAMSSAKPWDVIR